jgi:hypothetical protein
MEEDEEYYIVDAVLTEDLYVTDDISDFDWRESALPKQEIIDRVTAYLDKKKPDLKGGEKFKGYRDTSTSPYTEWVGGGWEVGGGDSLCKFLKITSELELGE